MTSLQRVKTVFGGLMMLLGAVLLWNVPNEGYKLIGLILSLVLLAAGVRSLWFYFSMARNMVGGRLILFQGIIALDLGMFAYTLQEIPPIYILLYLLIGHLFSGAVDVMRAMEARRMKSKWRLNLAYGIANILLAVACFFCVHNPALLSYVYAAGLAYSACLRIAQAFRKTTIVYIP